MGRRTITLIVTVSMLFFAVFATWIAIIKEPHLDEAWHASPSRNLAFRGHMGTYPLEPTGSWLLAELKGISHDTYWLPPVGFVTRAVWFRITGFGNLQTRLFSIIWGLLAVAAWFVIVERLANPTAAAITAGLIAVDPTFLWLAADGRLDMMYNSLGALSLAAYLVLRDSGLRRALIVSACFAACAAGTHPNGAVWTVVLAGVVLTLDRRRLRWNMLAAFTPYLVLGAAWLAYIGRHPDYFIAQWIANVKATPLPRNLGPFRAIFREAGRWVYHYGFGGALMWPVPKLAIAIPTLYWSAVGAGFVMAWRTRDRALSILSGIASFILLAMTFGDGVKLAFYFSMILPPMAAVAATLWTILPANRRRAVLSGVLIVLASVQAFVLFNRLRHTEITDEYRAVVDFLRQHPTATVTGTSALAFDLDDSRLVDDARLGRYTGRRPDYIVVDRVYGGFWEHFELYDKTSWEFILHILHDEYSGAFFGRWYRVYVRKDLEPLSAHGRTQ